MNAPRVNDVERRSFLRSLVTLPLIGGSITLIGRPTAAAVPITDALFDRYASWVIHEHAEVIVERERRRNRANPLEAEYAETYACHRREWARNLYHCPDNPSISRLAIASSPSTRAAVVLSAVGLPLA